MSRGQSSILQNLFQLHFAKEYLNSKSYVSGCYYVDKSLTVSLKHKSPQSRDSNSSLWQTLDLGSIKIILEEYRN